MVNEGLGIEEKILACHGKLNYKSIAKVLNIKKHKVIYTMQKYGKKYIYKSYSGTNL